MTLVKNLLGACALLLATASHAAVYNFEYQYNGTSLTLANGSTEMFGTALAVGDTVNLTYSAVGAGSYWNFSSISSSGNVNLGFTYPGSCGTRTGHGAYSAYLNGSTVLANSYAYGPQSCIHLGPDNINFSSVSMLDAFSISYTLDSSTAGTNIIGSYADQTWWQVWELFNGTVAPFQYVADAPTDVPEPSVLALLGLGLLGFGAARRRKA